MDPVLSYAAPPIDRREIIRYMGAKELSAELEALLNECLAEAEGRLRYSVCWQEIPVSVTGNVVKLGFAAPESASLAARLTGCDRAVLFAATVGLELDRLIARYSRLQPVKGLIFQAIGAERVEALCDAFSADVRQWAQEQGCCTRPRFSPGYGSVPLTLQTDIFRVLDCSRKIGLSLNGSLLMTPTKSVTAIIGLGHGPQQPDKEKCSACGKGDCIFRNL